MIASCQLLCAAEVFAPLSTSPWDVSVQPHGLVASSRLKKSFLSQEVVTCATRAQWNEVCTMLQEVNTAEISLRSKNATLWTRELQIEATGLGGKDLGMEGPWDISIRTDPEGQKCLYAF